MEGGSWVESLEVYVAACIEHSTGLRYIRESGECLDVNKTLHE